MMDRFLRRDGLIRKTIRFYPAVTPARFSCEGSMVSGRRSICAAAGARYNIASVDGADGGLSLTRIR
ncbi:hypothetical protein Hanom_Chr01g00003521 [Helianthus anomalus]